MKWIQVTKGDWDGFFGLGLNNFVNLLLIISLSQSVLGYSNELIVTRILPGMAFGIIFGNLFYSWQAESLARKAGKSFTAIPYGINLLPIFFYTFYVMLPAQQIALGSGATKAEADH
ncbi:MAG: NCS2 family permease, partial [Verrucomicrobiae bacterium]|nr:NCS2 family permease [Verrucomicrobiae bacterium]